MSDEVLHLTKLLAAAKAAEEANKKKEPSVAAAEELFRKRQKELEVARLAVEFARMPLGDIHDESTKENAQYVLKNLQAIEQLLAGQSQVIQASWFTDKKNSAFIKQVEELFYTLNGSIIKLLHPLNLGNYENEAQEAITKMQDESRKRQRVVEEKDAPRPPRLGCTCGKDNSGSQNKCGSRCPCRKDNKPCSEHCRCTADNCQNITGTPPARPERRGRPPLHVPVSGYMDDMEPTQRFPSNRRTSASEFSYQDYQSDGSPARR